MAKLVGYLRVSGNGQVKDGYGLETQKEDIEHWAKANGHKVLSWFEDAGISGTKELAERPGLTEAIDAILPPPSASGIVVARLDRLARSLTVQEAILATVWAGGATVYSADTGEVPQDDPDDPMRTFVRQVIGGIAQLDRALLNKRLKAGREAKKASGGRASGRPPYGWRSVGKGELMPVPEEQEALKLMVSMRAKGSTLPEICAVLTQAGYLTKSGGEWFPTTVKNLLDAHGKTASA
jgi:DNA invertase Pin-like site-specific DNA recombinase